METELWATISLVVSPQWRNQQGGSSVKQLASNHDDQKVKHKRERNVPYNCPFSPAMLKMTTCLAATTVKHTTRHAADRIKPSSMRGHRTASAGASGLNQCQTEQCPQRPMYGLKTGGLDYMESWPSNGPCQWMVQHMSNCWNGVAISHGSRLTVGVGTRISFEYYIIKSGHQRRREIKRAEASIRWYFCLSQRLGTCCWRPWTTSVAQQGLPW